MHTLAVLGALVASASVQAQTVGLSADLGSTGLGLHVIVPVMKDTLNARVGFNTFSYSYDEDTEDASYDAKLKLRTFNALLDLYPTSTQFRLTGGLVYNGNKITANAKPTAGGSYTFNGQTYNTSDVGEVDGTIDFRNLAPYVGIGWGNAVAKDKGLGFTADMGVMFQGSPDVNLRSRNCTVNTDTCTDLAADLAVESADLRDKAKDFRYYPVIRVGLTYKF
ncbi:hypothetical protein [Noviherbaspirillum agri]